MQDTSSVGAPPFMPAPSQRMCKKGLELPVDENGLGPSQRALVEERKKQEAGKDMANTGQQKKHENVSPSSNIVSLKSKCNKKD